MKTIIKEMNAIELAAYVCTKLMEKGVETTLSGGFCTEIYSHGAYTSLDIDLINRYNEDHTNIILTMKELNQL